MKESCVVRPSSRVVILCGLTWLTVSSSAAAPQQRARPSAFEKYVAATVRPTERERVRVETAKGVLDVLNATKSGLKTEHHD
jgi:hypothetical protein